MKYEISKPILYVDKFSSECNCNVQEPAIIISGSYDDNFKHKKIYHVKRVKNLIMT